MFLKEIEDKREEENDESDADFEGVQAEIVQSDWENYNAGL